MNHSINIIYEEMDRAGLSLDSTLHYWIAHSSSYEYLRCFSRKKQNAAMTSSCMDQGRSF
jgi:hypothetical protein